MVLTRVCAAMTMAMCVTANADSPDSDLERSRLAGIAKELTIIERLTYEAEASADLGARTKFNYDVLRADLNLIRTGIEEHVQTPRTEPRRVEPLTGDFRK